MAFRLPEFSPRAARTPRGLGTRRRLPLSTSSHGRVWSTQWLRLLSAVMQLGVTPRWRGGLPVAQSHARCRRCSWWHAGSRPQGTDHAGWLVPVRERAMMPMAPKRTAALAQKTPNTPRGRRQLRRRALTRCRRVSIITAKATAVATMTGHAQLTRSVIPRRDTR